MREHLLSRDVSRVTNMCEMFLGATSFNGDMTKWDVSSVPDMRAMFLDAKECIGDISNWDVSSVYSNNHVSRYSRNDHHGMLCSLPAWAAAALVEKTQSGPEANSIAYLY